MNKIKLIYRKIAYAPSQVWAAIAALAFSLIVGILIVVLMSWLMDRSPDAWQVAEYWVTVVSLAPILWFVFRYSEIARDQRKTKHYQAWQAIADAQGKPGNIGRKEALEDLNEDKISRRGVNLTGKAHLSGLTLPRAIMDWADLDEADLTDANLQDIQLNGASLKKAILHGADMRGAQLERADLKNAHMLATGKKTDLSCANLRHAFLNYAQAGEAVFDRANLSHSDLSGVFWMNCSFVEAVLEHANLQDARLDGADFKDAVIENANLIRANLSEVKNLTAEQVCSAPNRGDAKLPPGLERLQIRLNP